MDITLGGAVVPFDIELVFVGPPGTANQVAAFQAAADRWMTIIPGDVFDVDFSVGDPFPADLCATGQPEITEIIDDIRIYVRIDTIDGLGGTLASAGPCSLRAVTDIPILGSMKFDKDDLQKLENDGNMLEVVLHEMGHVLGIGTIWSADFRDLLRLPSDSTNVGVDTHFRGTLAIAAFDAAGGTSYTGGAKVPVENTGTPGSANAHWRESVLDTELMTPFLDVGVPNQLSAITIQSLADLGYGVDVTQADPFSKIFTAPPRTSAIGGQIIDLSGDIRTGTIAVIDRNGRIVEVRR
jgi:hypothetical protein